LLENKKEKEKAKLLTWQKIAYENCFLTLQWKMFTMVTWNEMKVEMIEGNAANYNVERHDTVLDMVRKV